ncbi:hypothetical protein L484_020712 [Morus notabilis]|uniref:DC1 domain-containing protein n=1 Tax=Morus notabilis TaxID=981085 RepID=W9QUD6_9ROSA|nr:hypothetical protein L484_020712 [Morus notabilis]
MEYSREARFPPIKHFSHEHALQKIWSFSTAICEICGQIFKWKYGCKPCRYYVHEECAKLPEFIINHALHPQHRLRLKKVPLIDNINCCYYCDKPFESDYKYYVCACKSSCSDNFYMHMKCAMIPLPTITITSDVDGYKDHGVAQFACHQQPMILVVDDHEHHHSNKTAAKCFGCQSNWSGPVYSCISEECENFLHKSCAECNTRDLIKP